MTITRDTYGVPNIHAGNDHDLWKGVGYAVAQDRLVQLELFRRATQGRLAELPTLEGRIGDDIVARRDYYTIPELQRMLKGCRPRCADASTHTPRASCPARGHRWTLYGQQVLPSYQSLKRTCDPGGLLSAGSPDEHTDSTVVPVRRGTMRAWSWHR